MIIVRIIIHKIEENMITATEKISMLSLMLIPMLMLSACKSKPPEEQSRIAKRKASYTLSFNAIKTPVIKADVKNGKVQISFDKQNLLKSGYIAENSYRLAGTDVQALTSGSFCEGVFIGDIGQDCNPVLCMLMEKGSVEILCLWDSLRTGDFATCGTLEGFNDIKGFTSETVFEKEDGDTEDGYIASYVTIFAWNNNNAKREIKLYVGPRELHRFVRTENATEQYTVNLRPDWKISYSAGLYLSDILEKYSGTFKEMKADYDENNFVYSYTMTKSWELDSMEEKLAEKNVNLKGTFNMSPISPTDWSSYRITPASGINMGTKIGTTATFTQNSHPK